MKQEPFSYRFPYEVYLREDVDYFEAEQWLLERHRMDTREEKLKIRSWITRRVVSFADSKHAMEFKLKFG